MPRKGNKGYSGVAILHKTNLRVDTKSSFGGADSFEHCEILFKTGSACLNVVVFYRPPPSKKNKLTSKKFFDEFTVFLQDRLSSAGDFLLVGDANFHLDKPQEAEPKTFLTLLDSLNFQQHVEGSTHRSGHTLDVVITRDNEHIMQDITISDMVSDHNLILCKVRHPKPAPVRVRVNTRKLRGVDQVTISEDISAISISDDDDVSVLTDHYHRSLSTILDKHAPVRTKMVSIRPSQPWFTDELHAAKLEKRKCERKWRKTGLTIHK